MGFFKLTKKHRKELIDLNERLCREYNQTDDPKILDEIAVTEMILLNDPDRQIGELEIENA